MENIERYLKQYIGKYIDTLDDIYTLFDSEGISIEQQKQILKQINDHNETIYKGEKEKVQRRSVEEPINSKTIVQAETENINVSSPKEKNIIEIDISEYIMKLKKCRTLEEIIAILPSSDVPNYQHIINKILLYYYQLKVEIINFLNEEKVTEEEKIEFEKDVNDLTTTINSIVGYTLQASFSMTEDRKEDKNQLIFLQSEGTPRIFQSMKSIDNEYYEAFSELLNSIIDGTFKGFKAFTNNENITGVYEVRGFKTRIIFDRIDNDKFIILDAFIKKCDKDLRYRNNLTNIVSIYRREKESLQRLVKDASFIEQQQTFQKNLFEMLENPKKKVLHNE